MNTNAQAQTEQTITDGDLEQHANFKPSITNEQMELMENAANDNSRGRQRRLALVACARSADVLSNLSLEEPEAFAEMLECIESFKEHLKGLAEMAESACIRMLIADCREQRQTKA